MWVRSQDKKTIIKVESINYHAVKEQITEEMKNKKGKTVYVAERPVKIITQEIMHHYIYINQYKFAEYSTKEKAIKVLDMIEKHLDNQSKIIEKSMDEYIISDINSIIFQLPKDEEENKMTETIFNACVNILAVEFLIKKNDRESYGKYIDVLYNISNNEEYESEKDILEICLPLNMHIRNLGEMITRNDYDEQKELLFKTLNDVLERGE